MHCLIDKKIYKNKKGKKVLIFTLDQSDGVHRSHWRPSHPPSPNDCMSPSGPYKLVCIS